jgi:hypothetical protein
MTQPARRQTSHADQARRADATAPTASTTAADREGQPVTVHQASLDGPVAGDEVAQIVPPSRFRPDVPSRLDTLVVSMLAADRENRPYSAQAVLAELRDIERSADLGCL